MKTRFLCMAIFAIAIQFLGGPAGASDQRIIVIGSSLAEIVVALGEADSVVLRGGGTDHIPEISDAARLPGYSQPSAEGMLALAPTLAIMSARRTKPIVKQQLEAAGVTVRLFEQLVALDDIPARVRDIAALIRRDADAERVIGTFKSELRDAETLVAGTTTKPRGLFLLSGGGRPTVVAGGDTHIAALIRFAGGTNITDDFNSFKPMSQESMISADPEFILVNKEGLAAVGGIKPALDAPGVRFTTAARRGDVFSLPSGYLTDLGLSTPRAIGILAVKIHPELR
ncbi:ABC transporter substrate-binding protein [Nisaea acidiphila]|uniref:ABC transporter substrate-binding protein n=1 Tax=Nisaea acidiphila TaxID=1862145 RepID=A0A9J7APT1_9PROT|nr:ABC transporter substrate-binding protein [Nisaea acidiphila]UUX49231.1 ABC transporter substrate-binding protein [Nisaea acidiphila]